MNKSIRLRVVEILLLVWGLVMLFGPMQQCTSVKAMVCNKSTDIVEILMIGLITAALIGIVVAVSNIKHCKLVLIIIDIISLGLVIFMPLVIGVIVGGCKKADMACRMRTFPFIYAFTLLFLVVHIVMIVFDTKYKYDRISLKTISEKIRKEHPDFKEDYIEMIAYIAEENIFNSGMKLDEAIDFAIDDYDDDSE